MRDFVVAIRSRLWLCCGKLKSEQNLHKIKVITCVAHICTPTTSFHFHRLSLYRNLSTQLPTQNLQLLPQKSFRINQLRTPINHPPLPSPLLCTTTPLSRSLRPLLQITILIHTTTTNHKHNRLTEPLASLAERSTLAWAVVAAEGTWHLVAFAGYGWRWHGATGVCGAGVEIEVVFCFGDGG